MMRGGSGLVKRVKSADFAVLWDLDGTLVDTVDLHVRAFLEALRSLGYDVKKEYGDLYRKGIGKRFVDIVRGIFPGMSEEEISRLYRVKVEKTVELVSLVKPLPAAALLPKVSSLCPCALVSSSTRPFVEAVLDYLDWWRYFSVVVTADDVEHGKPNPEPVFRAMDALGVSRAVLVGDTDYDRLCAERAGISFVHVRNVEKVVDICMKL